MNDFFAQEEAQIKVELERLNERLGLLQRYRELADGTAVPAVPAVPVLGVAAVAAKPVAAEKPAAPKATPATTDAPKKRGRPKGSKNKPKETMTTDDDGKSADLPTLLETIGQEVNKPLTCADFVTLVREAGYKTKAKDFSNMVYQALLKLVKRGTFKKNEETRAYEYVKQVA